MIKLIGPTATILLMATSADAQIVAKPLPEGRACAYEDVVGLWGSRVISAQEEGVEAFSGAMPNDYMRFKPDGEMMYIASNRAIETSADIHVRLDQADSVDGVSYRADVVSPGVLILWQNGNPFQGFTCTVVEPRDGKAVTLFSELEGMPPLRRVQTRLD